MDGVKPKSRGIILKSVIITLWLFAVYYGFSLLWQYENLPGLLQDAPRQWPENAGILHTLEKPVLVILAHPDCPCTRATMRELEKLAAETPGESHVYVLFVDPPNYQGKLENGDLWKTANAIPGVHVIADRDGIIAKQFNATVSGETLLYDANGRLVFHGGITGGRGHEGDNAGRSSITSFLKEGKIKRPDTFAFGCALFNDNQAGGEAQ